MYGHDGHDYPGAGGYMHTLHHMKINCNYGTANAPFDLLFGTVEYGEGGKELEEPTERYYKELTDT